MSELTEKIAELVRQYQDEIIAFAQKCVQTRSMTCQEKDMADLVRQKMKDLGYDEVTQDETGNILGRIGNGPKVLLFDSHMDTVTVIDADKWDDDPFGGVIRDGYLYGRGSVDMKCPLVASIYGAFLAKQAGVCKDLTIYVSASCMEEDYDGEAVRQMLVNTGMKPDGVIICEPTDLKIATGHRGRALYEINMKGKGCHASNPNNGINPVYLMTEVIERVEKQAAVLNAKTGDKGSLALTNIWCNTASNNSVPQDATIVLDRRLALGEDEPLIAAEMDALVKDTKASWCVSDIPAKSWTGKEFKFHSFLPAWKIEQTAPLVQGVAKAYRQILDSEPVYFQMQASTNGVVTAGMYHFPTVVFGPGDISCAHGRNERCEISSMLKAVSVYAYLCSQGF